MPRLSRISAMPLMPMPPMPMKCACCEVANMELKLQGNRDRGQSTAVRSQLQASGTPRVPAAGRTACMLSDVSHSSKHEMKLI